MPQKSPDEKSLRVLSLDLDSIPEALELARNVFLQCDARDYSEEGVREFCAFLDARKDDRETRFYGAYDGDVLIGTLFMRPPAHISGFFVAPDRQGRGVGRALLNEMKKEFPGRSITVNSSPYAVEIYKRLGFAPTDEERSVNGLRFTPMAYCEKERFPA